MATIINVAPPTGKSKTDMAAIDAAIKTANAEYTKNPGGGQVTVKLAAGTYAVTGDPTNSSKGGVELLSGVSLVGDGMSRTVIKLDDEFSARINGIVRTALTDVSNVSVSNLTIDGNRANNTDHQAGFICGAKADENKVQSDITLSGVEIRNCTAYGFNPHEVTANVTIEDCVSHGNGLDGFVADFVVGGIYRNNVSYDNDRHGFNIQNATSHLSLYGNKAYDNGSAGLTIQRGDILPSGYASIPWVTNIQVTGGEYSRNAKEGILVKLSDDVSIVGARIYGNLRQGIRVEGSSDTLIRDSFVFNNSQEADHTYDEIQIRSRLDDVVTNLTYYSINTHILNNTISSDGAINARFGIREEIGNRDGGATGTTVGGNKITGMDTGDISVPGVIREGTSGDDLMVGTTGADIMHGLSGNDTYIVNHSGDIVSEQADEGTDDLVRSSLTYTLTDNVEHLTLTGTKAVNGYGNAVNNRMTGNSANNIVKAGGGDDTLNGGGGGDTLDGGGGSDTYYIDSTNDVIVEKVNNGLGGVDTVYSSISYGLAANVERLVLTGSAIRGTGNELSNTLIGTSSGNILNGAAGADRMQGGKGNDTYYVDDRNDVVIEGSTGGNADKVLTRVSYTLSAYVENMTAYGSSAIDLTGNRLSNTLTGNAANNVIKGADGNDILNGGEGNNTLFGGTGYDVFIFNTALGISNMDRIVDFNTRYDTIKLENSIFKSLKSTDTLNAASFTLGSSAKDANDYIGYNKTTGDVWYDSNGNRAGGHVIFANVGADKALTYADFIVI